MASVSRSVAVSPFLVGDPVSLGPEATAVAEVARAVGVDPEVELGALPVAQGVLLLHVLTGNSGSLGLAWVHLPHAPVLVDGLGPTREALLLAGPVTECSQALRVVARLRACLSDPAVLEGAAAAVTREALARALGRTEADGRDSPLDSGVVLGLLRAGLAGLPEAEAARRREACGENRLERIARRSLAARLLDQFTSFFAVLLWVGGAFAFLAGLPELGWAIFAVIAVNGVFSFLQEYRAERAVEALEDLLPRQASVLRSGALVRVAVATLVPGDIVRLEEGDQVPADGQVLEAAGLRVDQSALTGESHPMFKLPGLGTDKASMPVTERHDLVFAGTGVVAGGGAFVVVATGMGTEIGRIARLTQAVLEEPSPLQREMARVTRIVTLLAVGFGAGFFALGVATRALPVSEGFLFALGVIVANVPEGLLPTLTLALALGVQRMARHQSVVKRLSSVEALGATTVICTDKTGTLTQNRMTARWLWTWGQRHAPETLGTEIEADVAALLEAGVLASQATLEHGDPTEVALVAVATAAGIGAEKLRAAHEILTPYPFDSFRKRMTLVRADGPGACAFVKGAPRETLALCTRVRASAESVTLDDEGRRRIIVEHDRMASEGLRILAVAVRPLANWVAGQPAAEVERDLTFLGLVALWDPPRPEVAEAVSLCRRAGIRVVMVTGDYGLTAQALARRIGLPVSKVVTGEELDGLPPEALGRLAEEPGVLFARTSPAHKLAIVSALKNAGEVVAVTGDGVNDAPALRAADIGVAMGKRGSDVAREAAVMVITDDNFASIVAAVRQGRAIYANMGKFVTYIFASNVPELVPFLAFVFLGIPLPLTVMQILAVDLGTDLLPALALGAEPPERGIMDVPPRRRHQALLGPGRLLHAYGFLGVAEAGLSLGAFFWSYWLAGWRPGLPMAAEGALYRRATTMSLAGIVAAQVGNVFACRTDRESVFRAGLLRNRAVLLGVLAEVGLLLTLIEVAPLARLFGLAPLSPAEWGPLLLCPVAMLLLEEGRKLFVRRLER